MKTFISALSFVGLPQFQVNGRSTRIAGKANGKTVTSAVWAGFIALNLPNIAVSQNLNSPPTTAAQLSHLQIRVGVPDVIQGPSSTYPDNLFCATQLANGSVRGFTAGGTTYSIEGKTARDMKGPLTVVLRPGDKQDYDASGVWINQIERSGNALWGWVHSETGDDPQGRGLKSVAIARSFDEGKTWQKLAQIITTKDQITPHQIVGIDLPPD